MLEKFATSAPVTRFLTVQEICRLPIGCEFSRRIFSKQLPIDGVTSEVQLSAVDFTGTYQAQAQLGSGSAAS